MSVPAIIAYPIRALFLIGVLIYFALGCIWYTGVWFYEQVGG